MNLKKLIQFLPVFVLIACTSESLSASSELSSTELTSSPSVTEATSLSSEQTSTLTSSIAVSTSSATVDEAIDYEGYTRVNLWPSQIISDYLADFDITDTIPNHGFIGSYWYATGEDEYGPYLEVFNLEPNAGVLTFVNQLTSQGWTTEDYTEGGVNAFVAYNGPETIYIEVFYYAGDSFFPAGITWYISPLLAEGGEEPIDGSVMNLTFADYTGNRIAITNGFQWTTPEGFVFKQLRGEGTSAPRTEIENLRVYQFHVLEFTLPTGYQILQIKLNLQVDYPHGPILVNGTLSNGTFQTVSNAYLLTPLTPTRTLTLTAAAGSQVRLVSIDVTFQIN